MARMKIFNTLEQATFDTHPVFNSAERKQFFALPLMLKDAMASLRTPTNKVCFLAAVGYFKARRKFFGRHVNAADIDYIARQLNLNPSDVDVTSYTKFACIRHQRIILDYFGCRPFDATTKAFAKSEIAMLVPVQYQPKKILIEIIQILSREKIEVPSYNILADLIITAISQHKYTLSNIIHRGLSETQRSKLNAFLEKENDNTTTEGWHYRLTLLKRPSQSTLPTKIKTNLADLETLQTLYLDLKPVISQLNLSDEFIKYYAYSVIKSQIPQVSRRAADNRLLHLIAFVAYQTFKLNDTLIDTLLNAVQATANSAEKAQKNAYFQAREQRSQSLSVLTDKLSHTIRETLSSIKDIVANADLSDSQKVALINTALSTDNAKATIETQLDDFKRQTTTLYQGQDYLSSLEEQSLKLQHRVADAIKSGALNLVHSEKYRAFDEYLIPKADWHNHRATYLHRAQVEEFADCNATLRQLEQAIDDSYREINQRLSSDQKTYLTLRKDGSFHISTPKKDEVECASLGAFFPERKYISMLEMLATVDKATNFLDEFEHWQVKYQRAKPNKKLFMAGVIGFGCDIGHRKLAQTSKQIDEGDLDNVVNWYFSLQNVQNANDRILRLLDKMNLPNIYKEESDLLHTSSDGQKFDVAVDSLNANYSFKYLGKDKGVSVVTFIDMRDLMWHSAVISSSEREAAYVIDGLMHNDVIQSDIHSTDTHGYSEVIFAATHLLHVGFAPRIKNVGRQQLYAFKKRQYYQDLNYTLLPDNTIREDFIEQQWDEMLRFVATIRLKMTTASQLFKRLNSYSRQHPLYRALKEFGKVPKTLFILQYCDDLPLRQAIEKQLNKGEGSNKFSRAISFGHNQEFTYGEKEDQEIAEGCRRLIKNAIICWNYLYLARTLADEKDEERRAALIEAIRNGSVTTWKHFNLHGEFDFSDERMIDSIGLTPPRNISIKRE